MDINRRKFLKTLGLLGGCVVGSSVLPRALFGERSLQGKGAGLLMSPKEPSDKRSQIYLSKGGRTPEQNVAKVIEMMGGIEKTIDKSDIVIIKPNAQWTGHATTNTNSIKGFIDLVLNIPGFCGEVIIAENHHYDPDNSRGWSTTQRNGDFNLIELVLNYNNRGHANVTKYHWRDGGPNPHPIHGNAANGGIVQGSEEGDGYVWCKEDYNFNGLKAKMTYPIFTSRYSGVTIDLRHGAWRNGKFTQQPVKLINFAALNHHGNSGVTAAIKNYMGIVDLSCGFHGPTPPGYYNFHYVGFTWPKSETLQRLLQELLANPTLGKNKHLRRLIAFPGPTTSALGGAIGYFMKVIRRADLNLIAAEYVGHESRWTNPTHAKVVLASYDPVALDYVAAKYFMLPLKGEKAKYHDPDDPQKALRRMLEGCHDQGIGNLLEKDMVVHKSIVGG
jgi:hypothetical protein